MDKTITLSASTRPGCSCDACVSACTHKPGWLRFGDEKIIAAQLGITVKEIFDKYLAVDFWTDPKTHKEYFGLSPVTHRATPGKMFPFDPLGTCIFFTADKKCGIHAVAPAECQGYMHDLTDEQSMNLHREVAESWGSDEAKKLIRELLGKEPATPTPKPHEAAYLMMATMGMDRFRPPRPLPMLAKKFIQMAKEVGIKIEIEHSPAKVNGIVCYVYFITAPDKGKQVWEKAECVEDESPENIEKGIKWMAGALKQLKNIPDLKETA